MWYIMNEEFNKIKEIKGTILAGNEATRLNNELVEQYSKKLFNNIGDLYYCDNEEKMSEIIVENIYDILCMLVDMNIQPNYFLDIIVKDKISELNGERVLPYSDVIVGLKLLNKFNDEESDYDADYYYNVISNINKKYNLADKNITISMIKAFSIKMSNLIYDYNAANDIIDEIVALMRLLYVNIDVSVRINVNLKDALNEYISRKNKKR